MDPEKLKEEIFEKVRLYHSLTKKSLPTEKIPNSGKVYDENELVNLIDASLKGFWTDGDFTSLFESRLANFLGVKFASTTNSGSSANLVAFSSLTSSMLPPEKRLKKGDEVITVSAGFPTTVNPIIINNCVPVFVDIDPFTLNANPILVEEAVTDKTKVLFLAHTLGNPFDLDRIVRIARENNLWLIEDNCDALGSRYDGKLTGTFGDLATQSFYPAHHITTAEGGAVYTSDPLLNRIVRSVRDWGRDCWCKTGKDNTCGKRFSWKLGGLPEGYDHKFIFSNLGYNLKSTDLHSAIGLAQMEKLESFIQKRKENFASLLERLSAFGDYLEFAQKTKNSDPSWFGFPIFVRENSPFNRKQLIDFLESNGVMTRLVFGGSLIKQPYFVDNMYNFKSPTSLENTDFVMNNAFWIGVYPAIEPRHIDYMVSVFGKFFRQLK